MMFFISWLFSNDETFITMIYMTDSPAGPVFKST